MKKVNFLFALLFLLVCCLSCSKENNDPIVDDNNGGNQEQSGNSNDDVEDDDDENEDETEENQITLNGASWTLFNEAVFSTEASNNGITLDLEQNAIWYHANQGGLVYQTITGDFDFTATVRARRKSNEMLSPNCNVCLGGLMARNPNTSDGENYVHLVTGNTPETVNDTTDELGVEYKTTTDDTSIYEAMPNDTSDYELRMVRDGSTFSLYYRAIGATEWILVTALNRPDLPNELQVGFNIYTAMSPNSATADLRVIYENISLDTN